MKPLPASIRMANWSHYAKAIPLKSVDTCRAAISAVHKIPNIARFILQDQNHVLHYRTTQYYEDIQNGTVDREKEGLWLIVGSNTISRKRVVRSWARRRVLNAIVQQLNTHGFDNKGRRLKGAEDSVLFDGNEIERLIGIVDVTALEKSVDCKYEELLRQAGILTQEIVRRCGDRRTNSGTMRSSSPKSSSASSFETKGPRDASATLKRVRASWHYQRAPMSTATIADADNSVAHVWGQDGSSYLILMKG